MIGVLASGLRQALCW